jgi:hypothetical protein
VRREGGKPSVPMNAFLRSRCDQIVAPTGRHAFLVWFIVRGRVAGA